MPFSLVAVNYVAVLGAAVVGFIIGMIWYSPPLFGKAWMRLSGIDQRKMEDMKKKMAPSMVAGFIAMLIMSFVLAHVIRFATAANLVQGLQAGFWVWLGFVATVMLGMVLWEGKPFRLYVLNAAHYLVVLLLMGAMLASWV